MLKNSKILKKIWLQPDLPNMAGCWTSRSRGSQKTA